VASGDGTEAVGPGRPEEITAVPVRHPWRWAVAVVVLLYMAALVKSAAGNPRLEWSVVNQYLFSSRILHGVVMTLELTAVAMLVGAILGVVAAVMRLSTNPVVKGTAWIYVWVFRGTPVLVQILFWFNVAAIYPKIALGVPFGPALFHVSANTLITPFVAAILGLGLNEGAYMSEIVRAGLLSVDEGQTEASQALGMSRMQTLRRIVLPQAMRVIIPPTGNETISMLKTTSLVSVVAVTELLYASELIYSQNYKIVALLIVASLWYIFFTSVLSVGQYYLERHYARGSMRELPETPLAYVRRTMFSFRHASVEAPPERSMPSGDLP
jgi:polar amino acid transport system permease protein